MAFSLKSELKKRILTEIISPCRKSPKEFLALILDPVTTKIFSSCLRMDDLMEAGVVILQNLLIPREKLDIPAIYFLSPTSESIDHLVQDYADVEAKTYARAHLFFTAHVPDEQMQKIKLCKLLIGKTKTFKEMSLDFLAIESRAFLFNRPFTLPRIYFPQVAEETNEELIQTAKQLVSVLYSSGEAPNTIIRYRKKSNYCKALADLVHKEMAHLHKAVGAAWKVHPTRQKATLLLVDRATDPLAPVMHEYTYQALIHDLLQVNGEQCKIEVEKKDKKDDAALTAAEKEKQADEALHLLNETDDLWVRYRHNHIGTVMTETTDKFKEFMKNNKIAMMKKKGDVSLTDLTGAVKDIPAYKAMMGQYNKHITIIQALQKIFDQKRLMKLGSLEQDVATGLSEEGERTDYKQALDQINKICSAKDTGVWEKARLLCVWFMAAGPMPDAIRRSLLDQLPPKMQAAIRNLVKLQVDLSTKSNRRHLTDQRRPEFERQQRKVTKALMRYVPQLYTIMLQLAHKTLSTEEFPIIGQEQKAPAPAPVAHTAPAAGRGIGAAAGRAGASAGRAASRGGGGAVDAMTGAVTDAGRSLIRMASSLVGTDKKDEKTGSIFTPAKKAPVYDPNAGRLYVFMLGGITFSEVRACYEVAYESKQDIIIGSTSTLTAEQYLKELANAEPGEDITYVDSKDGLLDDDEDRLANPPANPKPEDQEGKSDTSTAVASTDSKSEDDGSLMSLINKGFKKLKFTGDAAPAATSPAAAAASTPTTAASTTPKPANTGAPKPAATAAAPKPAPAAAAKPKDDKKEEKKEEKKFLGLF